MRQANVEELSRMLMTREHLLSAGRNARQLSRDVAGGALHRVRRGWYLLGDQWRELWPESRHRAHVIAVDQDAKAGGARGSGASEPVFSAFSAAALLQLPLYRVNPHRVHVMVGESDRCSAPDVFRHEGPLSDADIVEIDGIRCTSPERTVYDLARLASPEVAIVCADAALARIGGDPRSYDVAGTDEWIAEMKERVAVPRVRGIRQARAIIEIADGRSQLPLESVTKLQLWRLGFHSIKLQVPVTAPDRGRFWMDIEIEEARAFYECDGETKYTDEALRSGLSLEQVLLAEKRREDWVRGRTGLRVLRGGSEHAASVEALASRLASFGVEIPWRRAHRFLPNRPASSGT